MLDIFYTSKFKKDYKKMVKQGKPIYELEKIIFFATTTRSFTRKV